MNNNNIEVLDEYEVRELYERFKTHMKPFGVTVAAFDPKLSGVNAMTILFDEYPEDNIVDITHAVERFNKSARLANPEQPDGSRQLSVILPTVRQRRRRVKKKGGGGRNFVTQTVPVPRLVDFLRWSALLGTGLLLIFWG